MIFTQKKGSDAMHPQDAKQAAHAQLDEADRYVEYLIRRGDVGSAANTVRTKLREAARLLDMEIPMRTKGADE